MMSVPEQSLPLHLPYEFWQPNALSTRYTPGVPMAAAEHMQVRGGIVEFHLGRLSTQEIRISGLASVGMTPPEMAAVLPHTIPEIEFGLIGALSKVQAKNPRHFIVRAALEDVYSFRKYISEPIFDSDQLDIIHCFALGHDRQTVARSFALNPMTMAEKIDDIEQRAQVRNMTSVVLLSFLNRQQDPEDFRESVGSSRRTPIVRGNREISPSGQVMADPPYFGGKITLRRRKGLQDADIKLFEARLLDRSPQLITEKFGLTEDQLKKETHRIFRLLGNAHNLGHAVANAQKLGVLQVRKPISSIDLHWREEEMLMAMASGETEQQTAVRLHLGINTIKTYRKRLYTKINARCATDAVIWGIMSGKIPGNNASIDTSVA